MDKRPWVTFFSQTGGEIADISEVLGRWPDRIITNRRPSHLRVIDSRIPKKLLKFVDNTPSVDDYIWHLSAFESPLITLHGWLRVVPIEVCEYYNIFNGHPGLITKYPELKGKDPQVRAWEGKYDTIGAVLHKVTAGVDEGPIESWSEKSVNKLSLDETFLILRDMSLRMWTNFLKKVL
jgi:folate-dependent phosphoribosylglycinamide formyltransferase PurN